jgi:hypothetical protein
MVVDRGVATTTGISASMPMSLTLIEAIAGRDKAQAVAQDLGVRDWDARHDSAAFQVTRRFAMTAVANTARFWAYERLGLEIADGVDEVSLALVADAWSRTYRSHAVSFANAQIVQGRHGLRIVPEVSVRWPDSPRIVPIGQKPPAEALDHALQEIAARYGAGTSDFVATQLEYPRRIETP